MSQSDMMGYESGGGGWINKEGRAPLLLPFLIPKGETLRLVLLGSSERKLGAKELSFGGGNNLGKGAANCQGTPSLSRILAHWSRSGNFDQL